jgi:hypothetical protein
MTEGAVRDYIREALATAGINPNSEACSDHYAWNAKSECDRQTVDPNKKQDLWPVMDAAAYCGVPGEVVRAIAPHTEADPLAVLIQVLAFFGSVSGRAPYYQIEADKHRANLFVVLAGESAKARKGTSAGRVRSVFGLVDEQWIDDRMKGGLSSGEGLISEVRDEIKKYDPKAQQFDTIDPGVTDKRLMVIEAEFANALAVMERPGNTLSPVIRQAWDGHTLSTLTKNSPLKATGPHITICAHITQDELRARMTRTDTANGFANRYLYALVKRSQFLPHGGNLEEAEIQRLGERVKKAVDFAKQVGRVQMTEGARREWEEIYRHLSAARPGLLGAITARSEAQTIRLAMIYALLDSKDEIDVVHLRAALAVWEYCEASAAYIFGDLLGDETADEILRALNQVGSDGMTRSAIRDLFGRHRSSNRIGAALMLLMRGGRARAETRVTGGRPSEVWFATGGA